MNKKIEELYNKIDGLNSIIDQQALEISQLKQRNKEIYDGFKVAIDEVCETDREKREYKDRIDKAIAYIKECMETTHKINDYWTNELVNGSKLLEILGDKENE